MVCGWAIGVGMGGREKLNDSFEDFTYKKCMRIPRSGRKTLSMSLRKSLISNPYTQITSLTGPQHHGLSTCIHHGQPMIRRDPSIGSYGHHDLPIRPGSP
jgi:hypothetical protein